MRHVVFAVCLLTVSACRRSEPAQTEVVGPAVLTSWRTCDWADWGNTSCRGHSVLRAGPKEFENLGLLSPSPTQQRLFAFDSVKGGGLVIDTRTGEVGATWSKADYPPEWCSDTTMAMTTPSLNYRSEEADGYLLEYLRFTAGAETQRFRVLDGMRHPIRVLCGPEGTLAFALAGRRDEPPFELYRWSVAKGLELVETWPGAIEGGGGSDLVLSWGAPNVPTWCARSRPYSLGTCVHPPRPARP